MTSSTRRPPGRAATGTPSPSSFRFNPSGSAAGPVRPLLLGLHRRMLRRPVLRRPVLPRPVLPRPVPHPYHRPPRRQRRRPLPGSRPSRPRACRPRSPCLRRNRRRWRPRRLALPTGHNSSRRSRSKRRTKSGPHRPTPASRRLQWSRRRASAGTPPLDCHAAYPRPTSFQVRSEEVRRAKAGMHSVLLTRCVVACQAFTGGPAAAGTKAPAKRCRRTPGRWRLPRPNREGTRQPAMPMNRRTSDN